MESFGKTFCILIEELDTKLSAGAKDILLRAIQNIAISPEGLKQLETDCAFLPEQLSPEATELLAYLAVGILRANDFGGGRGFPVQ